MSEHFNLISEIALSADGAPRPIHILRVGTFTSSSGYAHTFEPAHLRTIAANFDAGKRKKPPITERHDFGRAVGRIARVWTDADGANLYAQPTWTASGKGLLTEEVYDGFSCEIDDLAGSPVLIGGSLTNYPAVGGLEPVTLAAPVEETQALSTPPFVEVIPLAIPALPPAQSAHIPQLYQGELPMSDVSSVEQTAFVAPPAVLPPISDPSVQARLDAYVAQQQAAMAQREQQIEARVRMEFERRMLETDQRNAIHAFARRATMTATDQPYAIPGTAEELSQLLLETPSAVRGKWQMLLTTITTAGLVSFDEIGSSAEGAESADRWAVLVNQKVAAGLSRVEAIRAVGREHPDLYAAQSSAKKGGR